MEDILVEIVENTRRELSGRKQRVPLSELEAALKDRAPAQDFAASLVERKPVAIIAEVKKASPSAGVIRKDFDAVALARTYAETGAAAVSVVTDHKFFQGDIAALSDIRRNVSLPLLRKDFIVDAYQVVEARAHGADAVLLISEVLSADELAALLEVTHQLGMQALVESHDRRHLEAALATNARLIGINNRNLSTFRVELMTTERLAPLVGPDRVLVSESGISSADDVRRLATHGVRAVLVGETLLRADDIPRKMRELMEA